MSMEPEDHGLEFRPLLAFPPKRVAGEGFEPPTSRTCPQQSLVRMHGFEPWASSM